MAFTVSPATTMSDKRIKGFNIKGTKQSLECPKYCYYCGNDHIIGIEIIGAIEEALIWECSLCNSHMLKFSEEKTERLLQKAPELDITMEEWEKTWQGKPN